MKSQTAGVAVGLVLLLGAVGCGSGSAQRTKGPEQPSAATSQAEPSGVRTDLQPPDPGVTARAAIDAMAQVRSLHVAGYFYGGFRVAVDLSLKKDGSCVGTLAFGRGATAKILATAHETYLRGGRWLLRAVFGAQADQRAKEIGGRWFKMNLRTGPVARLCVMDEYLARFDHRGLRKALRLQRGAQDEIDGVPAVELILNERSSTVHAWVATRGPARIVRLVMSATTADPASEGGTLNFDRFDEPVNAPVPAPSDVFDASSAH